MIQIIIGLVLSLSQLAYAEEASGSDLVKSAVHGFVDLNIYPYDTRDFSQFTINVLATLPYNLSYFSLVNYGSSFGTSTNEELENFYTEQNIYWKLPGNLPFDLTSQWAIASGAANDRLRFGAGLFISDFIFLE